MEVTHNIAPMALNYLSECILWAGISIGSGMVITGIFLSSSLLYFTRVIKKIGKINHGG